MGWFDDLKRVADNLFNNNPPPASAAPSQPSVPAATATPSTAAAALPDCSRTGSMREISRAFSDQKPTEGRLSPEIGKQLNTAFAPLNDFYHLTFDRRSNIITAIFEGNLTTKERALILSYLNEITLFKRPTCPLKISKTIPGNTSTTLFTVENNETLEEYLSTDVREMAQAIQSCFSRERLSRQMLHKLEEIAGEDHRHQAIIQQERNTLSTDHRNFTLLEKLKVIDNVESFFNQLIQSYLPADFCDNFQKLLLTLRRIVPTTLVSDEEALQIYAKVEVLQTFLTKRERSHSFLLPHLKTVATPPLSAGPSVQAVAAVSTTSAEAMTPAASAEEVSDTSFVMVEAVQPSAMLASATYSPPILSIINAFESIFRYLGYSLQIQTTRQQGQTLLTINLGEALEETSFLKKMFLDVFFKEKGTSLFEGRKRSASLSFLSFKSSERSTSQGFPFSFQIPDKEEDSLLKHFGSEQDFRKNILECCSTWLRTKLIDSSPHTVTQLSLDQKLPGSENTIRFHLEHVKTLLKECKNTTDFFAVIDAISSKPKMLPLLQARANRAAVSLTSFKELQERFIKYAADIEQKKYFQEEHQRICQLLTKFCENTKIHRERLKEKQDFYKVGTPKKA